MPTKEQKRQMAVIVENIRNTFSKNESFPEENFKQLEDWMNESEFAYNSSYRMQLASLKAQSLTPKKIDKPELKTVIEQTYSGMSGRAPVVITHNSNGLLLTRKYGFDRVEKIKIEWLFNHYGRLLTVNTVLIPENQTFPIMEVKEKENSSWLEKKAVYSIFPGRAREINQGFVCLTKIMQYQSILRFGHNAANELIQNLNSEMPDAIRDAYPNNLEKGQIQLREIKNNTAALEILTSAGKLLPCTELMNEKELFLRYILKNH